MGHDQSTDLCSSQLQPACSGDLIESTYNERYTSGMFLLNCFIICLIYYSTVASEGSDSEWTDVQAVSLGNVIKEHKKIFSRPMISIESQLDEATYLKMPLKSLILECWKRSH